MVVAPTSKSLILSYHPFRSVGTIHPRVSTVRWGFEPQAYILTNNNTHMEIQGKLWDKRLRLGTTQTRYMSSVFQVVLRSDYVLH